MFSSFVSDEVTLELLQTRFAEDLFTLTDQNRAYLRTWLPWVDGTTTPQQTREFIAFTLKEFANNNGFQAGIFYKGTIAGCIGLHGIDWHNRKTSIGYWLGENFQGKGIMTLSCKAILTHVFATLELNRVEIRAAVSNHKSRAIPERLGFTQEGTIRKAEWLKDRYVDHVIYGLLREEWNMEVK